MLQGVAALPRTESFRTSPEPISSIRRLDLFGPGGFDAFRGWCVIEAFEERSDNGGARFGRKS